jgi:hypothetical protein
MLKVCSRIAFVIVFLVVAGEASACCTSGACSYAVSSSSNCGTSAGCQLNKTPVCPVCNIFGCNCNNPCQCLAATIIQRGVVRCTATPCCGNDAAADRAAAKARFDELDANSDGKISRKETRAWLDKTYGKKWRDNVPNKGKATADQILKREFGRADADHNGVITPGELDPALR